MSKVTWNMEDFDNAVREAAERNKRLSSIEDDKLTRQARYMEARNYFETRSFDEFIAGKFPYRKKIREEEEFLYFWRTESVFSQWYPSEFDLSYINNLDPRQAEDNSTQHFTTALQYMMYCKAMLFLDRSSAKKILSASNPREIKSIGREIENFNQVVWDYHKIGIVYAGNRAKFEGNQLLFEHLVGTQGKTLVEAAPNDSIWGIGLSEEDGGSASRTTWKGYNLLGEILTQLRVDLVGEY